MNRSLRSIGISTFAAIVAACGGTGSEATPSATSIHPLVLEVEGERAQLAGTYDRSTGRIALVGDVAARVAAETLAMYEPGQEAVIGDDAEARLTVGDSIELRDQDGVVRATLTMEEVEWVGSLNEDEASTSFGNHYWWEAECYRGNGG